MEAIASNFKAVPLSASFSGGEQEPVKVSPLAKFATIYQFVVSIVGLVAIYYLFTSERGGELLKLVQSRIWSALYLTSSGEVATTYIPDASSVVAESADALGKNT